MKKSFVVVAWLLFLLVIPTARGQEKFIDVRQNMADNLSGIKTAVKEADWDGALEKFRTARQIWEADVKPIITEGVKSDTQFQEYFDRIGEVEAGLNSTGQLLENRSAADIEAKINAIIWGISHHPRGFNVPNPRYTIWDWIFGLGIGLGFILFATVFGLRLRRSYYRRYLKSPGQGRG